MLLKGVDLRDAFPSFSEKAGGGGSSVPFTTSLYDRYGLKYDALAKKDYIAEFRNWVFACVNARAESIGNMHLQLIDNKTGDEEEDHELIDLLANPNPYQTGFEFLYDTQAYKDLDGNAFWYVVREKRGADGIATGKPLQLFNLKADKVKILIDEFNPLAVESYIYTQPDGTRLRFDPSEIIHMKLSNPNMPAPFPHRGMGIVQASAFAIDTDNESRKWNLAFFRNAARPDVILYNQGDASLRPEESKRLQAEWEERHQGSDRAWKPAVLSGGMKVEKLTEGHAEMDFVQQRTFGRDEILAMFKVPKTVIGIADDVNRANADAAIYVYNLFTILPVMRRMVATLNAFLVPMFDESGRYEYTFVSPITEDREQLLDEYQMAVNVWLTVNEIRARENLPLIEGGDELYIPSLDTPVDESESEDDSEEPAPKKAAKKAVKKLKLKHGRNTFASWKAREAKAKKWVQKSAPSVDERSLAAAAVDEFIKNTFAGNKIKDIRLDGEKKKSYIEGWVKKMQNTGAMKKQMRAFFDDQHKEVIANLKDELKGFKPAEFHLKGVKDMLFDMGDANKTAIQIAMPQLKAWIASAGADAAVIAGGTFSAGTQFIKNWTLNRAQYFADTVNQTTEADLTSTLTEGLANKESINELSARVAAVYGKAQDYRTDMIARTEVSAASNFAAGQAYQQAGVDRQQWVVVDPQDEDCVENDGDIEDIDGGTFPSGDSAPPVHPNCQCTTIPVFNDDADSDKGDSDNYP